MNKNNPVRAEMAHTGSGTYGGKNCGEDGAVY